MVATPALVIPERRDGRYARVAERLILHGEPMAFRELCERVIGERTRYVVFDLDRTFHFGCNMGEALGRELMAYRCYGPGYVQLGKLGPLVMDWSSPRATLGYLAQSAQRWAWPGLMYLLWVKWATRTNCTRRWLHKRFGSHPVEAVQEIPRTTLLHALSELPSETVRMLARRAWRKHHDDQVILRSDIDWLRWRFPSVRVLISSASPEPVLQVAAEEIGADDVFYTSVERRDGYYSAPLGLDSLIKTMPRRIAPPGTLRHNAGVAKMQGLLARYPDFCAPGIETVGVTDTSYGEDHSWVQFFTKVVDINSPTPFAPIVAASSPLREIHSARVLTRAEIARRKRGEQPWLDRRRPRTARREARCYEASELGRILDPVLDKVEQISKRCDQEMGALSGAFERLEARAAQLQQSMERAVAEYNLSTGRSRQLALARLREHMREDGEIRRDRVRQERPVAVFQDLLTRILQESRAALETPARAPSAIRALTERYSRLPCIDGALP